jgi:hypothetical protein
LCSRHALRARRRSVRVIIFYYYYYYYCCCYYYYYYYYYYYCAVAGCFINRIILPRLIGIFFRFPSLSPSRRSFSLTITVIYPTILHLCARALIFIQVIGIFYFYLRHCFYQSLIYTCLIIICNKLITNNKYTIAIHYYTQSSVSRSRFVDCCLPFRPSSI